MVSLKNEIFLVTGASGYVASHVIKNLLSLNKKVRGTVRSLSNHKKNSFIWSLQPEKNDNLELIEANLQDSNAWDKACEGVSYVFHIASPVPPYLPENEDELIKPALEGTKNVLSASLKAGVKKIVFTSSTHNLVYNENPENLKNEDDWSLIERCNTAYSKSKLLAEKFVWEFYEKNKENIQISVVLPSLVLGPCFYIHGNSSETQFREIMNNNFPGIPSPDVSYAVVDVRDCAEGHLKAMFLDESNGMRFILSGGVINIERMVEVLNENFGKYGYEFPSKKVTSEDIEKSGNKVAQRVRVVMGKKYLFDNSRSVKVLGVNYRNVDLSVKDMAESLISLGAVENKLI